jgi:DNA primase
MSDSELIKSKLNIVDVVREYIPELRKQGRNWSAKSPFREEKSPSFIVSEDLGIYKDFGGDKSGDVISFVMEMENLNFLDALKILSKKAGIELSNNKTDLNQENEKLRNIIFEINEFAANLYNFILISRLEGEKALQYCLNRGLDKELIQKYKIGFASTNNNLSTLILAKLKFPEIKWENVRNLEIPAGNNTEKIMHLSGLFILKNGIWIEKFKERLMFPILDSNAKFLGFSGRIIENTQNRPKYINSPETLVYKKSNTLFNFYFAKNEIKKKNEVIITEGQIDTIISTKVGLANIVAPLGTSLTEENISFLKRYADNFVLCFDNDDAGVHATQRAYSIIAKAGGNVKIVNLTNGKDIDEVVRVDPEIYKESYKNKKDYILNNLEKIKNGQFDFDLVLKSENIKKLFSDVNLIPDPILKIEYSKKISEILNIPIINQSQNSQYQDPAMSSSHEKMSYFNDENVHTNIPQKHKIDSKEIFFLALLYEYDKLKEDIKSLPKDFLSTIDNSILYDLSKVEEMELGQLISEMQIPTNFAEAKEEYNRTKNYIFQKYKKKNLSILREQSIHAEENDNESEVDNYLKASSLQGNNVF